MYLDLRDPKIQADIQKSVKEYRAGKGRPAEELIAQLERQKPRRPKG